MHKFAAKEEQGCEGSSHHTKASLDFSASNSCTTPSASLLRSSGSPRAPCTNTEVGLQRMCHSPAFNVALCKSAVLPCNSINTYSPKCPRGTVLDTDLGLRERNLICRLGFRLDNHAWVCSKIGTCKPRVDQEINIRLRQRLKISHTEPYQYHPPACPRQSGVLGISSIELENISSPRKGTACQSIPTSPPVKSESLTKMLSRFSSLLASRCT